jgi:hypothetical protein
MASQCLGRKVNESLKFKDGHYFYTEKRCTKKTETILCKICEKNCTEKDSKNNGIMTEPLPPLSHIYGSSWYNLKRTVYGDPSSEDMARAKKAQDEARADIIATVSATTVSATTVSAATVSAATVSATTVNATTVNATTVSATAVKKRTFKVAATATAPVQEPVPAPLQVAAPVAATTPVKAKRQPKKVAVQPQETVKPLATESVEPPLQDLNCITITVRKIEHNGRKYYLNSDKDKLYTVMPDGGVGKYCGRLDKENDRIADFPDSDSER